MRVLLFDDHNPFRDSLAFLLKKLGPEIELVCIRGDPAGWMRLDAPAPDLILLDLSHPTDGPAALALFKQQCPDVPVISLSGEEDREILVQAMRKIATQSRIGSYATSNPSCGVTAK